MENKNKKPHKHLKKLIALEDRIANDRSKDNIWIGDEDTKWLEEGHRIKAANYVANLRRKCSADWWHKISAGDMVVLNQYWNGNYDWEIIEDEV